MDVLTKSYPVSCQEDGSTDGLNDGKGVGYRQPIVELYNTLGGTACTLAPSVAAVTIMGTNPSPINGARELFKSTKTNNLLHPLPINSRKSSG